MMLSAESWEPDMRHAKIINVTVERTVSDRLVAFSSDLVGLHVIAPTHDELRTSVQSMIRDLFEARGSHVAVYEAESVGQEAMPPWVVVPDVAEAAG